MADDTRDEITKLIICGFGLGAIIFFGYLIFKSTIEPQYDARRRYGFMVDEIPPQYLYHQQLQSQSSTELQTIQQKLSQLENKVDSLVKSTQINQNIQTSHQNQQDRQTVSLKTLSHTQPAIPSLLDIRRTTRDLFGMR
ncbi:MAG: hypothetical protein PHP08_00235 [Candidatus Dojkabacteria bacterium]|nr:hypothetical protein [Candidatus Dojkabacteria bacterium]